MNDLGYVHVLAQYLEPMAGTKNLDNSTENTEDATRSIRSRELSFSFGEEA